MNVDDIYAKKIVHWMRNNGCSNDCSNGGDDASHDIAIVRTIGN